SEMPARYRIADIFALPSRGHYETWGLAVNEAMFLEVAPLVSDLVGCQKDLVTDGDTGWVFQANDPGSLQTALGRALAAVGISSHHNRIRQNIARRIAGYTFVQTSAGL